MRPKRRSLGNSLRTSRLQRRTGRNPSLAWGPPSQGARTTLERVTADKELHLHS